jgi:formyl-CoA transferase
VDVAQLEAAASMMTWDVAHHSYLGFSKPRFPTVQAGVAPNIYMPCMDGYVVMVAFSDNHWEKLVEVMGSPEWADTELFQETFSRAQYWDALGPLLLEWTMAHSGREICELTQTQGLPCFPAYEIAEMVDSEQARARGSFVDIKGDGVTWRMPRPPFLSSEGPRYTVVPAPKLGQHTCEILSDRLGCDESAIAGLRSQGVI